MKKHDFLRQRLPLIFVAWGLLAGLMIVVSLIGACGGSASEAGTYTPEELEAVAYSIDRSLICPVCPAETIDQAQVQLAKQMRALVREKLAEGWTREQILDLFVESYGEDVLASPPKSGFNLLVWVVPPAGIAGALALFATVVVAMRRTNSRQTAVAGQPSDPELEPYLKAVDEELGLESPRLDQTGDETKGGASGG